jgi:site-specific DNA-cytosine methylase
LQRNLEARRAKGKGVAADAEVGAGGGCWWDGSDCAGTLTKQNANGAQRMPDKDNFGAVLQPTAYRRQNDRDGLQQDDAVAALRASQGASGFHEMNHPVIAQPVPFTKAKRAQSTSDDETWVDGQVNPTLSLFDQGDTRATTVAVAFHPTQDPISNTDGSTHCMGTGSSRGDATIAVAHTLRGEGFNASEDGTGRGTPLVSQSMTVRRLTPRECERLQGFPDDWTMIPYRGKPAEQCPDGPRYKALGNSMACNCMAWIGERIAAYEAQNGST